MRKQNRIDGKVPIRKQNRKELVMDICDKLKYLHDDVAAEKLPLRFLQRLNDALDEDRFVEINTKLNLLVRLAYKMPILKEEISNVIKD